MAQSTLSFGHLVRLIVHQSTNQIGCIHVLQVIQSDPEGTCHYSKSPTGLERSLLGGEGYVASLEQKHGGAIYSKLGELGELFG